MLIRPGNPGRRRRKREPGADLDVNRDRQIRFDGRFEQRPVLRLAVHLPRLQWDPDLYDAWVAGVLFDLPHGAGDVVGIDPDGAAIPVRHTSCPRASATPSTRCARPRSLCRDGDRA